MRQLAVASGLVMFIISIYVFIDYQASDKVQFLSTLRWTWIENVGIFKENGITLHLGIDGIAAVMMLLNGVVTFAGTLISWKIENKNKDFFILFFLLTAGVFGTFASLDLFFFFFFYELAVLPMYLLIGFWGSSSQFPNVHPHQGIQRHEADADAGRSVGAHLHRHLRHVHRSRPRHLRPAGALRARPGRRLRRELPEVGLPAVRGWRRLSGRSLALPHVVA